MGTQPVFITGIKPTYLQNYFYTPSVKIQTEGSPVSDNTILSGRSEWEIYFLMLSLDVVNKTHLTPQWTSTAFPALNPSSNQPCSCMHGLFLSGWGLFLELRRSSASTHQGIGPETLTNIGRRVELLRACAPSALDTCCWPANHESQKLVFLNL